MAKHLYTRGRRTAPALRAAHYANEIINGNPRTATRHCLTPQPTPASVNTSDTYGVLDTWTSSKTRAAVLLTRQYALSQGWMVDSTPITDEDRGTYTTVSVYCPAGTRVPPQQVVDLDEVMGSSKQVAA